MKIFANRSIWKKVVIIFSLIFSISFVEPTPVEASIGGTLMEPICDLLVGFADGIMGGFQRILVGQESTLIRINKKGEIGDFFRKLVTVIAVVIALVLAGVVIGGVALPIAGAVAAKLGLIGAVVKASVVLGAIVPVALGTTYVGAMAYDWDLFQDEIVLPMYTLSPEHIFSNTYPLFDVNFFNPNSEVVKYNWVHKYTDNELSTTAGGKYSFVTEEEKKSILDVGFSAATDVTEEVNNDFQNATNNRVRVTKALQIEVDGKKYIKLTRSEPSGEAGDIVYEDEYRKVNDGTSSGGTERRRRIFG